MKQYQAGDKIDLTVLGIRTNSIGDRYIAVRDDEKEYRIFDALKCQLAGDLPEKLHVYVKSIDAFGQVKFTQDIRLLLKEHYEKDKLYTFEITNINKDYNDNVYYTIEDEFAEQKYYFKGKQIHQIGDTVILNCKGANDKGWLEYEEHTPKEVEQIISKKNTIATTSIKQTNTFLKFGPESQTVEYKSSIVYCASSSIPDIESQLKLIVEELAALMNTKGGHLIIGVKDETGGYEISGIEKDFPSLNDEETDTFVYSQNTDGYRLKILHKLNYLCPMLAGSLVSFDFINKYGKTLCVINVDKSTRPIWVKGEKDLFIRQDGRMKRIWGEPLTEHIAMMMKISIDNAAGGAIEAAQLDEKQLDALIKKIINAQKLQIELPEPPKKDIDYWMVWQKDGSWQRQRNKARKCTIQVPVYKNCGKQLVLFCYESAHIVTMKLDTLRKKVNLKTKQTSQWTPGKTPSSIFIVELSAFVVVKSIDYNGIESIKLHSVSDFKCVEKGTAKGAPVLPLGSKAISYHVVGAEHQSKISHLIVPNNKRSQSSGEPVNSKSLQKEIAFIEALIKQQSK